MSLSSLVIARIKAQVPELLDVLTGADLAAINTTPPLRYPCAYVYSLSESGNDNRYMTGMTAQRRTQAVGVLLLVRNVRDAVGHAAKVDLDALRIKLDAALFGYVPAPEYEPLIFTRGALVQLADGVLLWQDDYTTRRDHRG